MKLICKKCWNLFGTHDYHCPDNDYTFITFTTTGTANEEIKLTAHRDKILKSQKG